MAIITQAIGWGARSGEVVESADYVGRVIEVQRFRDRRNMSDTMDYTDWRVVDCTRALVWLGREGKPNGQAWLAARPLEFHEQFAWIDCSNHFSDRVGYTLRPEVDADPARGGDPLMWANLLAWRSHQEGLQREFVAQREAEIAEQRAKFNERLEAERLQKERLAAGKLAAEQLLAEHAPEKDAEVTVDGVTGKVFWKGVKYYRNSWRSTVGVKDKYGTAHWIDIKKFMPAVEKAPRRRARRVAEAT